jgi:hypothetical protein
LPGPLGRAVRDRWGLELRRVLEPGPEPAQAP